MKKNKLIIVIISLIAIVVYLFYLTFPLAIVGTPAPLYTINNKDTASHHIQIQIIKKNNGIVFQKNYTIPPNTSVRYDRAINWHSPFPSHFIEWSNGDVLTFHFLLDDTISENITNRAYQYETILVDLYSREKNNTQESPIKINIISV